MRHEYTNEGTYMNVYVNLSNYVASGSDITPCNKIDKPLVVYRFSNVT